MIFMIFILSFGFSISQLQQLVFLAVPRRSELEFRLSYEGDAADRKGGSKAEEEARDQNLHSSAARPRGGGGERRKWARGRVLTGRKQFQALGG